VSQVTETLEQRYSDPQAEAVPWSSAAARVAAAEVNWIVTVRPDGRPHATPVVSVFADDRLYFTTGTTEVKRANLCENPHVLALAGDTAWEQGLDVVIEGTAEVVSDEETLRRFADLYRKRWDGRWEFTVPERRATNTPPETEVVVFEVAPTKAFGHSKGDPFGQTNYRFTSP
jgi:nitroimidazol reductase NimA-like FMN-containing flavoprotein (pyridoxamine 5'-phosphate oxidase superfamily)